MVNIFNNTWFLLINRIFFWNIKKLFFKEHIKEELFGKKGSPYAEYFDLFKVKLLTVSNTFGFVAIGFENGNNIILFSFVLNEMKILICFKRIENIWNKSIDSKWLQIKTSRNCDTWCLVQVCVCRTELHRNHIICVEFSPKWKHIRILS